MQSPREQGLPRATHATHPGGGPRKAGQGEVPLGEKAGVGGPSPEWPGGPGFPLEPGYSGCSWGFPRSPITALGPATGSGQAAPSVPCLRTGLQSGGGAAGVLSQGPQRLPALTWDVFNTYPNYPCG